MAKYLVHANYVGEGLKALIKDGGSSRRTAITESVESVGGTVEQMYYAFGDTDAFLILDLPDDITDAGLALATDVGGAVAVGVTVLFTPEQMDTAAELAAPYRPPAA